MNWKGAINWVISAVGAFSAGFFMTPLFVDGLPLKAQVAAGLSAGIAAMVQHIRNNPFSLG